MIPNRLTYHDLLLLEVREALSALTLARALSDAVLIEEADRWVEEAWGRYERDLGVTLETKAGAA